MSKLLIVDDEPAILRLLQVVLEADGHDVITAGNASAALSCIGVQSVDAVLLDLGLPDRDGLELIVSIRAIAPLPIIVVSARGEVAEKVAALDLGATDYITKPFDGEEVRARIRAALRQVHAPATSGTISHGDIVIDSARHEASVAGRKLALTPKEFSLLQTLAEAGGRVLTHTALLESVWGKAHRDDVEYLRVTIRALRLKVEADPSQPKLIRNEPGIGYRLG